MQFFAGDRAVVDHAVAVAVGAVVARGEADHAVGVVPDEVVDLVRARRIGARPRAPGVGLDACLVVGVGRIEEVVQIVRDAAQAAVRIEQRLRDELGLGRGALDLAAHRSRVAVAQHRAGDVRAVAVRIVRGRSAECDELGDPAAERRMDVRRRALVEAGVVDDDDLPRPLVGRTVDDDVGMQDRPGHVVVEAIGRRRGDVADFVERGDVVEVAVLHAHADLVLARFEVVGIDACRRGDLLAQGRLARINALVEDNVDLVQGARRCRARRGAADRGGARRWHCRAHARRNLECLVVDACPGDEGQAAHLGQAGFLEAAEIGVVRHVFVDDCAGLGQVGQLLAGHLLVRLDQDVVRLRRICLADRRGSRDAGRRIERDTVDGDAKHGSVSSGPEMGRCW